MGKRSACSYFRMCSDFFFKFNHSKHTGNHMYHFFHNEKLLIFAHKVNLCLHNDPDKNSDYFSKQN
jgi:hypothetical protein